MAQTTDAPEKEACHSIIRINEKKMEVEKKMRHDR